MTIMKLLESASVTNTVLGMAEDDECGVAEGLELFLVTSWQNRLHGRLWKISKSFMGFEVFDSSHM